MTPKDERGRDRRLDELLPWYVNGTLEPAERKRVEAYVDRCPAARKEVEQLRSMRRTLKQTTFPSAPGEFGLARLKRDIKSVPQPTPAKPPSSTPWKIAAAAACLLAVIQGGVLVGQWLESDVTTASVAGPADAVIQVTFDPGATESAIRETLRAARVTIVEGPSALGVYRLALVDTADGKEARERAVASAIAKLLARRDVVADVSRDGASPS